MSSFRQSRMLLRQSRTLLRHCCPKRQHCRSNKQQSCLWFDNVVSTLLLVCTGLKQTICFVLICWKSPPLPFNYSDVVVVGGAQACTGLELVLTDDRRPHTSDAPSILCAHAIRAWNYYDQSTERNSAPLHCANIAIDLILPFFYLQETQYVAKSSLCRRWSFRISQTFNVIHFETWKFQAYTL